MGELLNQFEENDDLILYFLDDSVLSADRFAISQRPMVNSEQSPVAE